MRRKVNECKIDSNSTALLKEINTSTTIDGFPIIDFTNVIAIYAGPYVRGFMLSLSILY